MTQLQIVHSLARLQCTKCGAEANASCDCGEPYVPAALRVKQYDEVNPGQSTRQAATDLGVHHSVVADARKVSGNPTTDTVTGRDGKKYPARRTPEAEAETESESEIIDDNWMEAKDAFGFLAMAAPLFDKAGPEITAEVVPTPVIVLGSTITFTASSANSTAGIGPFRYTAFYDKGNTVGIINSTTSTGYFPANLQTSTGGPPTGGFLVSWYDYGSAITLTPGETFTISPDASSGIFQIA
jgi:hypothetical protein